MKSRIHTYFQRLMVAALTFLPALAVAEPCAWVVSPTLSQALYAASGALAATDCALGDQTASASVIVQSWHKADLTLTLKWTPRACQGGADGRLEPLAMAAFAGQCPETARRLQAASAGADWPAGERPVPVDHVARPVGADYRLVQATAVLLVLAALGLAVWLWTAWRALRRLPPDQARPLRRRWQLGAALFGLALAMRCAVPPSLSNWYTPTLNQSQVPRAELYGSGHVALQWLLRETVPWGDTAIFAANQLLGSLIVVFWFVALLQRGLPLRVAGLAAGLLAVVPLHVRLTNSASEHVLAAAAWLAALMTAQAAMRRGRWLGQLALALLAALLALLTALTRLDAAAPLAAIAGWLLIADYAEQRPPLPRRLIAALAWLLVWVLILALIEPMVATTVISRGTPLPHTVDRVQALHDFVPGLRRFYFARPFWLGPILGIATLLGLGVGLRRRPLLTLLLAATLLTIPAGIARSTFDFIMMRYYLPVLPLLTLPAALALAPLAHRRWVAPLVLLSVIAVAWPAWRLHYGFQDEYAWLRERLRALPADCRVNQISVSHRRELNSDVDCCLDVTRCPLVAELPGRTFGLTDSAAELRQSPGKCRLYYEGAICSLQPTAELLRRRPEQYRTFMKQCADLRSTPGLRPLAEATVSTQSHFDAFGDGPVRVRLFQLDD